MKKNDIIFYIYLSYIISVHPKLYIQRTNTRTERGGETIVPNEHIGRSIFIHTVMIYV